jgi:hypothetical protein
VLIAGGQTEKESERELDTARESERELDTARESERELDTARESERERAARRTTRGDAHSLCISLFADAFSLSPRQYLRREEGS